MSAVVEKPTSELVTPEDLQEMADGERFELVDGHLVEREMGNQSSWIELQLARLLGNYIEEQGLGWVFGATAGYQCFSDRSKIRRPDCSFIARDRFSNDQFALPYITTAPDLAVEVISPNENWNATERKIADYLEAGVKQVWIVDPEHRTVHVRGPRNAVALYGADDELPGEPVVPGFRLRVAELFPPIDSQAQ
ncbi:MAG: Uma2 family endonuclease [Armatimonadota bacterium]